MGRIKTLKNWMIIFAVVLVGIIFTVRAAITGITYDEAFTFLAYVIPLENYPSLNTVYSIFYGSVANNHWLNTFLIAIVCSICQIQYNEFLIRLPAVLFGWLFLIAIYKGYKNRLINGVSFSLMLFGYYLHDFFGLARGYGGAATLILIGILLFLYWEKEQNDNDRVLVVLLGILVLSAYANSVALISVFCIGIVILYRLILSGRFKRFLIRYMWMIPVYGFATAVILKYHFRVSGTGMPLFASSDYSFFDMVQEYISMFFEGSLLIRITSVLIIILLSFCVFFLAYKKILWKMDIGIAFLLYICVVISIDSIFKRGGLFGRTLLPAYPLVAIGAGELVYESIMLWIGRFNNKWFTYIIKGISTCAVMLMLCSYAHRLDLTHTRDWYDDYNIRTDFYSNPDFEINDVHASVVFYSQKKEWDYNNLLHEYTGLENTSYKDEIAE